MRTQADRVDGILAAAADGVAPSLTEALELVRCAEAILPDLMAAARAVTARRTRRVMTYSRSVFIPLTNICRDRCGYCTFRKDADEPGAWILTPDDVRRTCEGARQTGCREVLFSLGDKPEVFPEVRERLAHLGYRSMLEYLTAMCRLVAEEYGLFAHTNAGVFGRGPMAALREWNVSMGLMLESVSERLLGPGMAHDGAPDKRPGRRLRMLELAGELKVPFTTGLLLGIGETPAERVEALEAIRRLHLRHGHIQEIIIQNFRAKPGTPMAGHPEPAVAETLTTLCLARLLFGPQMNLQVPPNLNPDDLLQFQQTSANDWGGVSPLTVDFINPEMPWPAIERLRRIAHIGGLALRERLPVYPEFLDPHAGFVAPALLTQAQAVVTADGYVRQAEGADRTCLD